MQLLSIERIPIEYQIRAESPRLEVDPAETPKVQTSRRSAQLQIHTEDIRLRLDTTDMRRSMGLRSTPDLLSDEAQKGQQAALRTIGDLSSFGTRLGQIQNHSSVAQLISQKILSEQQPNTITAFLPSIGPTISWEPAQIDLQYQAGELKNEWEINRNILRYIPGKFQIIIEQYPGIKIEYLGKPSYVPPSAAPDYEVARI